MKVQKFRYIISYTSEGRIVGRFLKLDFKLIFSTVVKSWISVGNEKSNQNALDQGWKMCTDRQSIYNRF